MSCLIGLKDSSLEISILACKKRACSSRGEYPRSASKSPEMEEEGGEGAKEPKGNEETYIGPSRDLDDEVEDGLGLVSEERDVASEGKEVQRGGRRENEGGGDELEGRDNVSVLLDVNSML